MAFIPKPALNTTEIEARISDLELFRYYCPNFKNLNSKFIGDLRSKDTDPSASITMYMGKCWYKDFGDPLQDKAYNIYTYLMYKYSLSFIEVLQKINNDLELGLAYGRSKGPTKERKLEKSSEIKKDFKRKPATISIRKIHLTSKHVSFWEDYGLDRADIPSVLSFFDIVPISHFWITSNKVQNRMIKVPNIAFSYEFYPLNEIMRRKIYLPGVKNMNKFFGNTDKRTIQGFKQLPKNGDLLFITSSMKDLVILWYLGYYAIAPPSENTFIDKEIFYRNLKSRFKNIVIFFDNDYKKTNNPGLLNAKKYSTIYEIPFIILPNKSEKDPSDFSKHYGLRSLNYQIKKELENVGIFK